MNAVFNLAESFVNFMLVLIDRMGASAPKVMAGCILAAGTGFVTLLEPVLEYERQAYEMSFKVEQKAKTSFSLNMNCAELQEVQSDCKTAVHMRSTSRSIIDLVLALLKMLIAVFSLSIIFYLIYVARNGKESEEDTAN